MHCHLYVCKHLFGRIFAASNTALQRIIMRSFGVISSGNLCSAYTSLSLDIAFHPWQAHEELQTLRTCLDAEDSQQDLPQAQPRFSKRKQELEPDQEIDASLMNQVIDSYTVKQR